MTTPAALLAQITDVADGVLTEEMATDVLIESIGGVLKLKGASGWASLQGYEVSAVALTRALGDIMKDKPGLQGHAATLYAALLSLKDAPVGTLCEPYAFSAFVHCLRNICLPSKREQIGEREGGTQQGDAADEPMSGTSPLVLLQDIGTFLEHHSMRGSPDMFQLLLETLLDFTGSTAGSGKAEKGNKRGGAAARNQGVSVAEATFALLPVAMDTRHASATHIAAMVCHRLTPALVGMELMKRGTHGCDRRVAALNLINSFFSANEAARQCRPALMRRLCLRVPDKADCRQTALASVQALLPGCAEAEVYAFCLFVYRLSRTPKIGSRMFAVEMSGALLSNMPTPFATTGAYRALLDGSCGAGDKLDAPWSAVCLAILVSRSNDKAASVRSKAIGCLGECTQFFAKGLLDAAESGRGSADVGAFLPALNACRHLQVQVTVQGADDESEDGDDGGGAGTGNGDQEAAAAPPREAKASATIPSKISLDLTWMRAMCHARCRDDKAAVRKVALLLLESVLQLCAAVARGQPRGSDVAQPTAGPTAEDVQVIEEGTVDSLVSVRKTALQVICSLVECYPHHAELASVWVRSVLPMVRDPESSVQEVVLERLSALLLEPLVALAGRDGRGRSRGGGDSASAAQQFANAEIRQRFAALAQIGRAASSCLGRALGVMATRKLLKGAQIAAGLEAFLTAECQGKLKDDTTDQKNVALNPGGGQRDAERERRRVVRDQREGAWMLLVEVAGQAPAGPSWQFLQRCWEELQAGGSGAEGASQEGSMLLWVISHAASRFPAGDAAHLASGLLKAILGFNLPCGAIAAHLAALHKLTQAEDRQGTVGAPAKWCAQVQEACEEVLAKALEARGSMSNSLATHCHLALFTFGEVVLLREAPIPGGAAVKVQALTYERSAGQGGASAAAHVGQTAVCAHAWTCLGKMCMVDEALAKKCVPLIVQEMSGSPSPVVRTNLLMALADMVVQFTGLADAYVGRLADMVRDPHELVRRQALALLANLLLRDYVKWRGVIVHRFLLALVDESPSVRQLAQYLLSDSLTAKAPLLAYNHFIESLFVLNACSAGLYASRANGGTSSELASELLLRSSQESGGGFHLKGSTPIIRAKRDIIYMTLLRRMSPEHRFSAFARLTAEVLGGIVDGLLPLQEAEEVLGDTLRLLACKDMKVAPSRFGASAEEDVEQEDASKARGKLVGAMMRKHLAESVIPLMVELRYLLQAQKHPLLGSLMLCMATLLRDYKAEVHDILASDKQLALEIAHDLKHYETLAKQQQRHQEEARAAALAPRPPAAPGATGPSTMHQGGKCPLSTPAASEQRKHVAELAIPGVEPSRTPVAAEVLATASKRKELGLKELTAQCTPHAAAGAHAAPSTAAMISAAGLQSAGLPHAALRTPRTVVPGSAQRVIPGGMSVMLSPAPLSIRARATQQQRVPGTTKAAALPLCPTGATRSKPGGPDPTTAMDPLVKVTVVLPSPLPSAQPPYQAVRALGPHNLSSGAPQPSPAKLPQRTPPAMLAAAVKAARQAAVAALCEDENGQGGFREGEMAVDMMDVGVGEGRDRVQRPSAFPEVKANGSGMKASKATVKVKQERGVAAVGEADEQVPAGKDAGGLKREGKSRTGKRRHGGA